MRNVVHGSEAMAGLAAIVLSIIATVLIVQTVYAHEVLPGILSWRWDTDVDIVVEDRTTDYGSAITDAVEDYDDNTDLSVSECTTDECGIVIHLQADWGASNWKGKADPYSYGQQCTASPYPCDTTTDKVDFSYVYWNDYDDDPDGDDGEYVDSIIPDHLARHEMGHVFGLGHHDCTGDDAEDSVVEADDCDEFESLQDHDTDDLNGWY